MYAVLCGGVEARGLVENADMGEDERGDDDEGLPTYDEVVRPKSLGKGVSDRESMV